MLKKLQKQLQFAYEMARVSLKQSAEKQTRLYNQTAYGEVMKAGDVVWYANKLRKKGVSPKLQLKWKGPCLITEMHNEVLTQVQLSSGKSITVHTDLLKPCHSQNLPGWLRRLRKQVNHEAVREMDQSIFNFVSFATEYTC